MIMNGGIMGDEEAGWREVYRVKGRVGHRLYIGGRVDKRGDGMFRDKR